MNKNNNKGFTLVELLVVIAIVGILAVVAVPSLIKNIDKAKISEVKSDVKAIELGVQSFYIDNQHLPCFGHGKNDKSDMEELLSNLGTGELNKSPFGGGYYINCIHPTINNEQDYTRNPNRTDIGGFTISESVLKSLLKDGVEYKDSNGVISVSSEDIKDDFFQKFDTTISGEIDKKNITVWMYIEEPK